MFGRKHVRINQVSSGGDYSGFVRAGFTEEQAFLFIRDVCLKLNEANI